MDAVAIGYSHDEFWAATPKIFNKYIAGYKARVKLEMEKTDALNHLLGHYIAFAFNQPKKYPRLPFLIKETTPTNSVMSDDEMERMMMKNTILAGGQIKEP